MFLSVKKHKELTVILDGDLTEGVHHDAREVITRYMQEQEAIAIDAIDQGLRLAKFKKSDRLYFVDGSGVHADESEDRIAADLGGVPYHEMRTTWPALKLKTPMGEMWVAHKGPSVGEGNNEGNALYNKVRHFIVEELKFGRTPPRFVIFAHRHIKTHRVVELGNYRVDAWILPPNCAKSEYGFSVAPFTVTEVGGLVLNIEDKLTWDWKVRNV